MGATWDPTTIQVAALEQLPIVVWAFAGPDHVAVLANRAGREYRGGSLAHLLGRSARESELAENQPLMDLLDEVYRTGAVRTFYETGVRIDGEERFVTFTATPLRDGTGGIVGVITYLTDVTEAVLAKRDAERERAVVQALQALQDRLLPAGLPVLPGLVVAARYRAAGEQLVAGGDWYDALVIGTDRVAASVGDVIGHGPAAAALMGQLRSVLDAALLDTAEVGAALARLRRFVSTVAEARGSTACAATLDAVTGRLRYAGAGHPPPVLVGVDGTARFLPTRPSAPLGMPGPVPVVGEAVLAPGESVVLYSDGAVERPGVPTEHGRRRLLAACRAVGTGAGADGLVESVLADRAPADDLALLVLTRRLTAVAPLHVRLPATPAHLGGLRRELRRWLVASGISEDDAVAVQIACGEAAANAVEHAYPDSGPNGDGPDGGGQTEGGPSGGGPGGGQLRMSAELTGDSTVVLRVEDDGRWRGPPVSPAERGRGLLLMRQCMDDVQVRHPEGGGTTVELVRRVHGASSTAQAALSTAPPPDLTGTDGPQGIDVRVEPTAGGVRAVLTGDLDTAGVVTAALAVRRAARGGLLPLSVDLTGLGHLASAGVRLLFDLAGEVAAAGNRLRVRVTPGSAAQHVLDLVGFPQVAGVDVESAT